jgi:RimJ/RimL family protein N-acetyltransferase
MKQIVTGPTDVIASYVAHKVGMPNGFGPCTAIGLLEEGALIAGVVYNDWTGGNVFAHVAAEDGRRWLSKEYLRVCFEYPFTQLGVNRVTGWVEESNLAARKFDEHLGFELEARLKGAARDGGDVLIYVLWKDKCRFIGDRYAV